MQLGVHREQRADMPLFGWNLRNPDAEDPVLLGTVDIKMFHMSPWGTLG